LDWGWIINSLVNNQWFVKKDMQNKDIVIIALVVLVIYLYYQQTQQKTLPIQPNNQELQELRNQISHYQKLYQSRVEKDLSSEEKIKKLNQD